MANFAEMNAIWDAWVSPEIRPRGRLLKPNSRRPITRSRSWWCGTLALSARAMQFGGSILVNITFPIQREKLQSPAVWLATIELI